MIIVGDRRAEDHQQGVTDDLIDGALVTTDDLHHGLEVQIENLDDLVRAESRRHGREAAQVGHQDARVAFLAAGIESLGHARLSATSSDT